MADQPKPSTQTCPDPEPLVLADIAGITSEAKHRRPRPTEPAPEA